MSKYPFVYVLRDDRYKEVDNIFESKKNELNCTVEIISPAEIKKLNNMFDSNHHLLVTYGDEKLYINEVMSVIVDRMRNRWIHKESNDIQDFNESVNFCYIHDLIQNREQTRPRFSIFTTCYKSYEKIYRAYNSLKTQVLKDWEWVLLDDSPEDEHFNFLRKIAKQDKRIRLYKRDCNSGNIGNVKNEAVGLCRGKYVLELDHDDIIFPKILQEAYDVFEKDEEIGFVYADFANIYENGSNFSYNDYLGKGYAGYYMQKFNNHWFKICSCPGINNITTSHLVCLPNHPRMWRRKTLLELGNYSEFLPICDDFEILMRTMCNTKVAKIHKIGYIQFMNDNANNFSLIRNGEINRLGPCWIQPIFYEKYKVNEIMKSKGAYEDSKYIHDVHKQIWKRDNTWQHKKTNITVNPDYDKQYCIIGYNSLSNDNVKKAYENHRNDFMVLDNTMKTEDLINHIESLGYSRMKCYSLLDTTENELINYFHLICKYTDNYEIILNYSTSRHGIINHHTKNMNSYLEIGVEYGHSFSKINIKDKIGVDPDPKIDDERIEKLTSDNFFEKNTKNFDAIFIDGMHQSDYVLRDFNNSIECLNENGVIIIDDIVPDNEREQHKIPIKHEYENGILKYREPWTGDVWKVAYYLIKNFKKINCTVYRHPNYRGIGVFRITEKIKISPDKINEIQNYDYKKDFTDYLNLISPTDKTTLLCNKEFLKSKPFNHIIIDNFVDRNELFKIEQNIRDMDDSLFLKAQVTGLSNVSVNKLYLMDVSNCDESIKKMVNYLNSDEMVKTLEDITGIKGLQSDNFHMGGGIHKTQRGGHLNIHADFNKHRETGKYRRVNLLLYMNSNYKKEYQGELELWSKDMKKCEKKIEPLFNRAVIFRTTDDAFHGHLGKWLGPDGYDRLSFAMYYYTDDRPENEKSDAAFAQWQTPVMPRG